MKNLTKDITGVEIREAIIKHKVVSIHTRSCSICDHALRYLFKRDRVFYDSNCDCTTFYTDPEPRTWDSVAFTYNNMSQELKDKIKIQLHLE